MTKQKMTLLGPITHQLSFSISIKNGTAPKRGLKGNYTLTLTGNSLSYTITYIAQHHEYTIEQTGTRFKPLITPTGRINFCDLPSELYDLAIESDYYYLFHQQIDLSSLPIPAIDISLEPKTQINGTVQNGTSAPVPDAIVWVNKEISTITAPDGTFKLDLTWMDGKVNIKVMKQTYQTHSQRIDVVKNNPNTLPTIQLIKR